ncbi:secondary thiamine-phosphate synthase enzyme YjbQ [Psychrobacter sp.]|uniref:secondary thiamine-phosphate synthase enzyme YjbQ n=1 Tax=Psychrobacter sp. TaxID=56811 RepID=UPI0025E473EF|nr:secondary thiamine-phosphate synthase enzyme YjbQ [Psychrobacter sp.]
MAFYQTIVTLPVQTRGVHIITSHIQQALDQLLPQGTKAGLVNLFLQHTSASLTINENADPDVRLDTEDWLNQVAPADQAHYRHTLEGSDDLPAHFKSMMLGVSLDIPLINGRLGLGTWQGVYLCEHRNHAGNRRLIITVNV